MVITRTAPRMGGPVISTQEWADTTFVHWRVDPDDVAPFLPPGVVPDVVDGSSWVGLIAFRLHAARFAPLLAGPGLPAFTEVNVRVYATDALGRHGVVFLSMEAGSLLLTAAARASVSLPYFWARAEQHATASGWRYTSVRRPLRRTAPRPAFRLEVRVDETRTVDDDLSAFLTARWGLFQRRFGRTRWMPDAHEPWTLHPAQVVELAEDLCAAAGFPGLAGRPPDSVLFSPGVTARFGLSRTVRIEPD